MSRIWRRRGGRFNSFTSELSSDLDSPFLSLKSPKPRRPSWIHKRRQWVKTREREKLMVCLRFTGGSWEEESYSTISDLCLPTLLLTRLLSLNRTASEWVILWVYTFLQVPEHLLLWFICGFALMGASGLVKWAGCVVWIAPKLVFDLWVICGICVF